MIFWRNKKGKATEKSQPDLQQDHHDHNHQHQHNHQQLQHQHHHHDQGPQANPKPGEKIGGGIAKVKNIVAVASGKGGVGKSTVTANLAIALKSTGAKVGLLDADIYGPSQPTLLNQGKEKAKGFEGNLVPIQRYGISFVSMGVLANAEGPVVWRAPMAIKVLQQFLKNVLWGELDYLLIDLPPGTGDVQITLAQQASLTGAIIVTTPQEVAVNVAKKGLQMFEQVNVPIIGIIENMSGFTCKHCSQETMVFHQGGGEKMAFEHNVPFLGKIPLDPEIMMSSDDGIPVTEKNSSLPVAKIFFQLANKMKGEVDKIKQSAPKSLPVSLELSPQGEVLINWGRDHQGFHTPYNLRLNCPCANCVDENTGRRLLLPQSIPLDIKAQGLQMVGRYGISIRFSDGHGTGIYKFTTLLNFCECPQCLQGKPARGRSGGQGESFNV